MGAEKSKIDLEQLRKELKRLTVRRQLYKVLKEELTLQGHWKQLKRGKPRRFKPEDLSHRHEKDL
jgi:alkylated DNA repair dioxygenase AlkB